MGIVSTEEFDLDELASRLAAAPQLVGENLVKTVSCPEPHPFPRRTCPLPMILPWPLRRRGTANPTAHRVVAYDCGVKRGIL